MENENNSEENLTVRIGIVVNTANLEDIAYYNEQLQSINKMYANSVFIVILGYKPEDDKNNTLDGVEFEYYKPVSIIHYYKYIKDINIDLLFVPLIQNIYNATSESYKKYLEAGINSIPVIAPNMYPYNRVIRDKENGFLFGEPEDCGREHFIPYLKNLLQNEFALIKHCGIQAKVDSSRFDFNKNNIKVISDLYS